MRKVIELKALEGLEIESNKIVICHLQVADDKVLLGKASVENVKCLRGILRLFEVASGLMVNFHKSSIHSGGVEMQGCQNFVHVFGPSN